MSPKCSTCKNWLYLKCNGSENGCKCYNSNNPIPKVNLFPYIAKKGWLGGILVIANMMWEVLDLPNLNLYQKVFILIFVVVLNETFHMLKDIRGSWLGVRDFW